MAEGSDGVGSEMEEGVWNIAGEQRLNRKKRKKVAKEAARRGDYDSSVSTSEGEQSARPKQIEEYKVIIRMTQEGQSFGEWSPVKLTKAIHKVLGEVKRVKVLRSGALLVLCRDGAQQGKAIRMSRMEEKSVVCSMPEVKKVAVGVISNIPTAITCDEIRDNIEGARVLELQRLKTNRNGEKTDSLSVKIRFEEPKLPDKVYIGYMCYDVRPFVPPPLRCFKCQKYGHVAAVCRGKQKCGRCAGDHEYGKCQEGAKIKCCNCGGEHTSAYRGCEAGKKAAEIQKVKTSMGISYAEAAKKVGANYIDPAKMVRADASNRVEANVSKAKENTLTVSKNDFVLFMVEVINCSAQTNSKTEKIKIIIKAAEKYLDIKGLSCEKVQETLAGDY
ncbi:uncharacterized protein LOC113119923 [Xyrichtys novacula]|uniref:Uncharacterized protein LOC113119923 n=1 Tax=Xyrichtys novacula TaxID=13765 RepID=A0AAV1HGX3_XYRNO|nr:uncharacterized protein LOC113119923 [Xyrichtys novacula]